MSASKVQLGGIDLAACHFEWPKYRGITPHPVVFEQPAGLYESFKSLALSLAGATTTLRFEGPAGPGTQPGSEPWEIDGVYIGEVSLIDSTRCRIVCYDRRYELRRRVFDKFYRVRFGDGYLEGTEKDTAESVFRDFAESIDLINDNLAPDAFVDVRTGVNVPEGVMTQGLPALVGIGEIEELLQTDLVTEGDKYRFTGRADIDETSLPDDTEYSWWQRPGWVTDDNVKLQRPRNFVAYSEERHCIAITNDVFATVSVPPELDILLEQVYIDDGNVYTLDELLEAFGYSAGDMTDRTIARSFMSNSFQGTAIEEDGTEDNRRVREAIKDGWRTLWRLKFPNDVGHLGGWTDFAFGKINADGSTQEASVYCKWVEFFEVLELQPNQSSTIGAKLADNNEAPSPFRPVWEMGPEAGIVRLLVDRSKLRDKQNYAIPGELIDPPTVTVQDNVSDDEGVSDITEFYKVVEASDFSKVKFQTGFDIAVYICATRRMPNNETRWHAETVEGYKDGDVEDQELPPAEQMTVRDYVAPPFIENPEEGHEPQADGLGPILNQDEVTNDAKRRAEAWKIAYGQQAAGEGIAESIMLARDTKVTGAIRAVSVVGTVEGEMGTQVLRSRIEVGNLNDHAAIMRRASKRINVKGGVKERGIERQ